MCLYAFVCVIVCVTVCDCVCDVGVCIWAGTKCECSHIIIKRTSHTGMCCDASVVGHKYSQTTTALSTNRQVGVRTN